MHRNYLLSVTGVAEAGTGFFLLFLPAAICSILFGVDDIQPAAILVCRITGAALIAIGVACWFARSDENSISQYGLTIGVAIYNIATAVLLAYAGLILGLSGLALWPAIVIHTVLALWSAASLGARPSGTQ